MQYARLLTRMTITLATLAMLSACTENSATAPDAAASVSDAESFLAVNDDLETLQDGGVAALDSAYGVFSLGWNQFITPRQQEAVTSSHAFAVAYDELRPLRIRRGAGGVDLGSVTISYGGNGLQLSEKESRFGGFLYALFKHRHDTTAQEIEFIGGATYTFDISGSDAFNPLTVSVTAPAGAVDIGSHANEDTVNAAQALTLGWSGGTATDPVMLRIVSLERPKGPHGPGHHPGERPLPHQKPGAIFVKLDNNPGSYTVTAEQLQELLGDAMQKKIAVHVSQAIVTEITHDGKPYHAALRTGERLVLNLQ